MMYHENKKTGLKYTVDLLSAAGIFILAARYAFSLLSVRLLPEVPFRGIIISLILTFITMIPPAAACKFYFREVKFSGSSTGYDRFKAVIAGAAGCMTVNFIMNMLPVKSENPSSAAFDSVGAFLLSLLALGIAPAVCEELLFRGCAVGMTIKFGATESVFVSAFIFGMFHSSPKTAAFAFLSGLILGMVRVITGSTIAAVAVHLINNITALCVSAVGAFVSVSTGKIAFYAVGVLSAAVAFVCILRSYRIIKSVFGSLSSDNIREILKSPGLWLFTASALTAMLF